MAQREINEILQRAIDDLPNAFRLVLVARAVEGMSIEDTAELLGILPETVKTRLHRARALLRAKLERDLGPSLPETFPFEGDRCDRVGNEKAPSALGPWSRRNGSCPQSSCCLPPSSATSLGGPPPPGPPLLARRPSMPPVGTSRHFRRLIGAPALATGASRSKLVTRSRTSPLTAPNRNRAASPRPM
jgi:sigma-70-like protein